MAVPTRGLRLFLHLLRTITQVLPAHAPGQGIQKIIPKIVLTCPLCLQSMLTRRSIPKQPIVLFGYLPLSGERQRQHIPIVSQWAGDVKTVLRNSEKPRNYSADSRSDSSQRSPFALSPNRRNGFTVFLSIRVEMWSISAASFAVNTFSVMASP